MNVRRNYVTNANGSKAKNTPRDTAYLTPQSAGMFGKYCHHWHLMNFYSPNKSWSHVSSGCNQKAHFYQCFISLRFLINKKNPMQSVSQCSQECQHRKYLTTRNGIVWNFLHCIGALVQVGPDVIIAILLSSLAKMGAFNTHRWIKLNSLRETILIRGLFLFTSRLCNLIWVHSSVYPVKYQW